jgi:UDP-N-acetylmuramoyl-tripeptide--D-alanyl-D-alanine ligase
LSVGAIAELAGGRATGGSDVEVTGVAIDSRRAAPGDLFVALAGDRADGHAFLVDAAERGAVAVMVRSGADVPAGIGSVLVEDTRGALSSLAEGVRSRLGARVIAVTGSSGKTITKELIAAVARGRFRTVASEASFNNEIGVPLTILAADETTEVVVAEVGARGVGHIAALMPLVRPDIGVVLNVGTAHVGMFGSVEAIARAKGELVEALPRDGFAVLNADDAAVAAMAARTPAQVVRFGLSGGADVVAGDVEMDDDARARFTLRTPGGAAAVRLGIPGEHLVHDALAAAAAGMALGIGTEEIAAALSAATAPAWRMEVLDGPGGSRIINDAYNANPESVAAALKTLVAMGRGRRTWAVLGVMAELGDHAPAAHDRVGRLAVRLGVRRLVTVGEETRPLHEAARLEGMTPEEATAVRDADEAIAAVRAEIAPGDVVLVKASRAAGLERVALALSGVSDA